MSLKSENKMRKRIGLLYSLSGTISIVGVGQLHASLMAIDEINRSKATQFEPVIVDVQSDPHVAAREAYRLLKEERVSALVGCYMSSVRNSVISVLNETGGLLLYPTVYEGEQTHPNIFYLGAVPNQQVEPALSWAIENLSTQFIIVGSDYIYPRCTNKQAKEYIENAGGRTILEEYFPLGCQNFDHFFERLKGLYNPLLTVVVFSTIVGDSVVSFYKQYKKNNISFPIISPITSEREIQLMGSEAAAGHICTSSYFQNLKSPINKKFVNAFISRYGNEPISREMASSYDAIHLLSSAFDKATGITHGVNDTEKIRRCLKNACIDGLQGKVMMNPRFQHLWQWSRLGRVQKNGVIASFWQSAGPVPPKFNTIYPDVIYLASQEKDKPRRFSAIVGRNKKILECIKLAKVASTNDANVLITGETGTGKEMIAQEIHANSDRRGYPFVPINCVTIPKDLIASELFGYEGGTFTGAKKGGRIGKFEIANGGTLFLDEIGEMAHEMQAVLLRAIEEKEIYRIGSHKPVSLNFRLITATNRNIEKEIQFCNTFRKDLFYRLSVFHIKLPSLSERTDDIPELANHFLNRLCLKNAITKSFLPETLNLLLCYPWPGNIRELKNIVERSFYISENAKHIAPKHLPEWIINCRSDDFITFAERGNEASQYNTDPRSKNQCIPLEKYLNVAFGRNLLIDENEKNLIEIAISKTKYNLTKAADMLGVSRTTLYRKIKKYEISTR
jgi:DNA-binding NtrC family response regulator/ABC-type branched-subunit amino acid transport system substrate-binding protein